MFRLKRSKPIAHAVITTRDGRGTAKITLPVGRRTVARRGDRFALPNASWRILAFMPDSPMVFILRNQRPLPELTETTERESYRPAYCVAE